MIDIEVSVAHAREKRSNRDDGMRRGAHSKSAPRLELPSRGGWNDGSDIPGSLGIRSVQDESVVTSGRNPLQPRPADPVDRPESLRVAEAAGRRSGDAAD